MDIDFKLRYVFIYDHIIAQTVQAKVNLAIIWNKTLVEKRMKEEERDNYNNRSLG